MKRSLSEIIKTNFPDNLKTAVTWLIWTVGSVIISVGISVAVAYTKEHYFNPAEAITHGELFAFSASLVIGSGRLILKDEDLEDFSGRQYFGLFALLSVFLSELMFFIWKVDQVNGIPSSFGKLSICTSVVAILFVFLVVLIDASRIPRPNIPRAASQSVDELLKQVEGRL